jgi:putative sterol carrier protein
MPPTTAREYMQLIQARFDPSAAEGLAAVYQFDLSGSPGGQYHLVVGNGTCAALEGSHQQPDVTFSLSESDCIGLFDGELDGASLYLSGRLKVAGDLGLALRLSTLFPRPR